MAFLNPFSIRSFPALFVSSSIALLTSCLFPVPPGRRPDRDKGEHRQRHQHHHAQHPHHDVRHARPHQPGQAHQHRHQTQDGQADAQSSFSFICSLLLPPAAPGYSPQLQGAGQHHQEQLQPVGNPPRLPQQNRCGQQQAAGGDPQISLPHTTPPPYWHSCLSSRIFLVHCKTPRTNEPTMTT